MCSSICTCECVSAGECVCVNVSVQVSVCVCNVSSGISGIDLYTVTTCAVSVESSGPQPGEFVQKHPGIPGNYLPIHECHLPLVAGEA